MVRAVSPSGRDPSASSSSSSFWRYHRPLLLLFSFSFPLVQPLKTLLPPKKSPICCGGDHGRLRILRWPLDRTASIVRCDAANTRTSEATIWNATRSDNDSPLPLFPETALPTTKGDRGDVVDLLEDPTLLPDDPMIHLTNQTSAATDFSTAWAALLLNGVAVIWGTQHAVIKGVVTDDMATSMTGSSLTGASVPPTMLPALLTWVRFTIAAVLATPPVLGKEDDRQFPVVARWGLEMGLYMFLGFSLQAIGLQTTTAQRSGFLLYLNVKLVPFLAYVLYQRPIRTGTWISALTAFTGTVLLSYQPLATVGMFQLNNGDLWTIAAAVASAMFILRLEAASAEVEDAAQLNAASLWVVSFLALFWIIASSFLVGDGGGVLPTMDVITTITTIATDIQNLLQQHLWELVYLGGVTTALANWIQTKAQRSISAERASIIYAMDPVYGAFFSYLLLGETLNGITGWTGAALIVIAAATNAMIDVAERDPPPPSK
jgi:drug/metabolite transporter (DMT)-like permease